MSITIGFSKSYFENGQNKGVNRIGLIGHQPGYLLRRVGGKYGVSTIFNCDWDSDCNLQDTAKNTIETTDYVGRWNRAAACVNHAAAHIKLEAKNPRVECCAAA